MSIRDERVSEVMERAKNRGLRLEFDSGLLLVKRTKPGDPEKQDESIAELRKYISDIRRLAEGRAIGARAKEFVGQRIFSEDGEGTLVDASEDGTLTVSVGAEIRRSNEEEARRVRSSLSSKAERLLILDEIAENGTSSPNDEATSEQTKNGFFERLRRGPRKE